MKRFIPLILLALIFISCTHVVANDPNTFPSVDYSSCVYNTCYKIPSSEDALTVFNLFYNEYGYGEFNVEGTAEHCETTKLIGVYHTEKISCKVTKIKVYNIDYSTPGERRSAFFVDLYNDKNEVLQYCYKWEYRHSNVWINGKTSGWFNTEKWYKESNNETRTNWNIEIKR